MAASVAAMLGLPGMGVTLFVDDVADFLAGVATADGGSSCPNSAGRGLYLG